MGYRIPRGAGVMMNVWAIHNDAKRHPEPRRFDPARYLEDNRTAAESASSSDPTKRDHFTFGAGRRFCQGTHIAERSLFLAITRLLWAFDIQTTVNGQGEEILPDAANLSDGIVVQPRPFSATITPRSQERIDIIREEWRKMEDVLDAEKQWKVIPGGLIWNKHKSAAKMP